MLVLVLATKSPYAQAGNDELDDQSSNTGEQNVSRGTPRRNTMWPLQSVKSQSNLDRLFCGRNMTAPGPFCNLKGGAAYLLAGRFDGSSAPEEASNATSSLRTSSKAWSTARNVPWIIADYILTKTATQKAVGVSKKVDGTAQVDVFLCSDVNCTVMADITTIMGQNVTEADPWCPYSPMACYDDADTTENGSVRITRFRYKHGSKGIMHRPRRVTQFRMLGLGPVTAIPTAVIKNTTMVSFVRAIGEKKSPDGDMRYEVVWQDSTLQWDPSETIEYGSQSIVKGPVALMPVGVLLRLDSAQEWESDFHADTGYKLFHKKDSQGLQLLQYGLFNVRNLESNDNHCALIVLPALTAGMYELGWNKSSANCTKPAYTYVFDTEFPQALYLDKRVKLIKSYSIDDPQRKSFIKESGKPGRGLEDVMMREDPTPQVSPATVALAFEPNVSAGVQALPATRPLELDVSALRSYGYRLGLTRSCVGRGTSLNGPWDSYNCGLYTHAEAGCVAPRCALLQVGTAFILAWKFPAGFKADGLNYSLQPEYRYAMFESMLSLKAHYMYPDDVNAQCRDVNPDYQSSKKNLILSEGITPGSSYLMVDVCPDHQHSCPYWNATSDALDCNNWERRGYGLPHGRVDDNKMSLGPATRPLREAFGDVMSRGLDEEKSVPFLEQGFLPANALEDALEAICDSASSLLSTQLAVGLVGADSTKSLSGALLDLSVTIVAIIAMANGRKDLEGWLYGWSVKALCGRLPVPRCISAFAKVCTCLIIGLSLIVAPAAALVGELAAKGNNPKGDADSTSVGWLSANTGFGNGPYYVTAVVTITLTFQRDEVAFRLVIVNIVLASLGALSLCLRVLKPQKWFFLLFSLFPHPAWPLANYTFCCRGCQVWSLLGRPARRDSKATSSSEGNSGRSQDAVIVFPAGSPSGSAAGTSQGQLQHSPGQKAQGTPPTDVEQQEGDEGHNDLLDQDKVFGHAGLILRYRGRDQVLLPSDKGDEGADAHGGDP